MENVTGERPDETWAHELALGIWRAIRGLPQESLIESTLLSAENVKVQYHLVVSSIKKQQRTGPVDVTISMIRASE